MTPPATPQLSLPARIVGLAVGMTLTAIGVIYGFIQGISVQVVILAGIATLVAFVWGWRFVLGQFVAESGAVGSAEDEAGELRQAWRRFRAPLIGFALILLAFLLLSLTVAGFFNVWNVLSLLILLLILVLTGTLGRHFE